MGFLTGLFTRYWGNGGALERDVETLPPTVHWETPVLASSPTSRPDVSEAASLLLEAITANSVENYRLQVQAQEGNLQDDAIHYGVQHQKSVELYRAVRDAVEKWDSPLSLTGGQKVEFLSGAPVPDNRVTPRGHYIPVVLAYLLSVGGSASSKSVEQAVLDTLTMTNEDLVVNEATSGRQKWQSQLYAARSAMIGQGLIVSCKKDGLWGTWELTAIAKGQRGSVNQ